MDTTISTALRQVDGDWDRLVEAIAAGDVQRPAIRESRERAREAGADGTAPRPPVLPTPALASRLRSAGGLLEAGRPHLERVSAWLDLPHVLVLTDGDGVVLDQVAGDAAFAAAVGVQAGSSLAESAAGTCGVALALATNAPAAVVGAEHFLRGWSGVTSIAVPIHASRCEQAGAVGLITPNLPGLESRLALAALTADVIGRGLSGGGIARPATGAPERLPHVERGALETEVFRTLIQAGEERERLVRHLERERERLREVLDEAPAGIMISIGPQHIVESVNQTYRTLTGGRDVIGRPIVDALPELRGQALLDMLDRAYQTGEAVAGRELMTHLRTVGGEDAEPRAFDVACQPLADRDGRVYGLLTHAVDVTDRVRARQAVERTSQAKSDFIAMISHELRTPLTGVLGYAELLTQGVPEPIPQEAGKHAERILLGARHIKAIIDQILTFSRLEAGGEAVQLAPVGVGTVVDEACALIRPMVDEKGLELVVDLADAPVTIDTDERKLRQILVNLSGNAVKYTDAGRIEMRVEAVHGGVAFHVRDTGIGIEPAAQDRIFEPFWQVESHSGRGRGGTGLGLSITRELVRLLGGSIHLDSGPGRGSTFTVRLPAEG